MMQNPYNKKNTMCTPQPVELDCRVEDCKYYKGSGICSNEAPVITLNPHKTFTCYSKREKTSISNLDSLKKETQNILFKSLQEPNDKTLDAFYSWLSEILSSQDNSKEEIKEKSALIATTALKMLHKKQLELRFCKNPDEKKQVKSDIEVLEVYSDIAFEYAVLNK